MSKRKVGLTIGAGWGHRRESPCPLECRWSTSGRTCTCRSEHPHFSDCYTPTTPKTTTWLSVKCVRVGMAGARKAWVRYEHKQESSEVQRAWMSTWNKWRKHNPVRKMINAMVDKDGKTKKTPQPSRLETTQSGCQSAIFKYQSSTLPFSSQTRWTPWHFSNI